MKNNIPGVSQMPVSTSIQDWRKHGGASSIDLLKANDKSSFAETIEKLAAEKKKGTTTEVYINAQGERILKITSDKGVQHRVIGHVDDAIWSIPIITV